MADLREQIREIVELVALVPESLKTMCFEMLLKDALSHRRAPHSPPPALSAPIAAPVATLKTATEPALDGGDGDTSGAVERGPEWQVVATCDAKGWKVS